MADKKARFVYENWASDHLISPNATNKEKKLWWEREEERWHEGHFGFTGPHYFALTQALAKDGYGRKTRVLWRDIDDEIYGAYAYAEQKMWDLMIMKRREIGLSLIFGGIIPLSKALSMPGSTCGVTSADKTRLREMFYEKLVYGYKNLDPEYRPAILSKRDGDRLHIGIEESKGVITGKDSKIISQETVKDPQAFEAFRLQYLFLDEYFLHDKADQVLKSGKASTSIGFARVAPIVLGGSAGESSAVGQKEGTKLWENSETLGLVTLFIPGTKGIMMAPVLDEKGQAVPGKFLNFCKNGHSDEKAAEEWINKTRDRLDKLEDKTHLEVFIKQYPLTLQEVLQANAKGALPKDILDKVNTRERILLSEKPPIVRGSMDKGLEGKIIFRPDLKGRVRILQEPIEGHTYGAGIDPIPFNSNNMGDGSNQDMAIKDMDTNIIVAWMSDRDSDPDEIVKEQINLQDYYNGAIAMLEINRGGVVKEKYKSLGRLDLLARKPITLGKGFAKGDDSIGYYKNDHTGTMGNTYFLAYLRAHINDIYFPEFLAQAKNWLSENTDFIDAFISQEIYHMWWMNRKKKETGPEKKKRMIRTLRMVGGRMTSVWEEVYT
jgi:hypothetical protein